jgi:lysozyme family protein
MNFDRAFDRIIGHEGGYTSGEGDPGGETKWGISKRSYPTVDIASLTRERAKEIYQRDFWRPIHADTLPGAVAFQLFDFAINSGTGTATRHLQRALGVADDGQWGPVSRSAMERANEADIVMRLLASRLDLMTRLLNWPVAGKGWARRIAANLVYAADDT